MLVNGTVKCTNLFTERSFQVTNGSGTATKPSIFADIIALLSKFLVERFVGAFFPTPMNTPKRRLL